MEHIVNFERGFNCLEYECRHGSKTCFPGGGGSHGIHGMNIRFVVKGDKGAVYFLLFTPFIPTEKSYLDEKDNFFMPAGLGYHAKQPQYKGHKIGKKSCEYLDGQPCYCSPGGGILDSEAAYKTLANAGEEDLWRFLEEYYASVFEGGEYPEVGKYDKALREPA